MGRLENAIDELRKSANEADLTSLLATSREARLTTRIWRGSFVTSLQH